MARILVDADACPVVAGVEEMAEKYDLPCKLFCDTNHVLKSSYSQVEVVGAGADAVDFALISQLNEGDVVVTQDYGVAAMALGKGAIWNPSEWKMVHRREYRTASDGASYG